MHIYNHLYLFQGLLLEEDQSFSFSSNICLESKRVYREISVMYGILNDMTVRRREKPRIANTDPIGKPQASECRGEIVHR